MLDQVLGSPVKERCGLTGESSVKGLKDDKGLGAAFIRQL